MEVVPILERIKSRTAGYKHRLDSMDNFLEYRAGQEIKKLRSKVVGEKHKELTRRGECEKGWKKAYEASGEMDRDIEAAKRDIVYLRPDAASDPGIIREYETEKAAMRLTEMMENGCFNNLSLDVDLLIDRLIDDFIDLVRKLECGFCSCAGEIPGRYNSYLRDTDGKKIETEYGPEDFKEYFEYLVEGRLEEGIARDILTDDNYADADDYNPAFKLMRKWFLEQNPDISKLLAQVPSCGAVDSYIRNYVKNHVPLIDFITEQICEAFNALSEDEYLELNLENDDEARDMYNRYVLDI